MIESFLIFLIFQAEIREEEQKNEEDQKPHNTFLIELNPVLSPGKDRDGGQENTKYLIEEGRIETELERVFHQLREGQKIR